MRLSKEIPKGIEARERVKSRDVTRTLGEATLGILKKVFDTLPNKPKMANRTDAIEWAMSLRGALKGMAGELASKSFALPSSQKDKKTLLGSLTEPTLASALFLSIVSAAGPGGAETLKKEVQQKTEQQHELVVDMKKDPSIGQFIPEKKPYEAILYDADEMYAQLKAWKAKHPNVKRIEVSEFRAAIKHTHDDVKRTHKQEGEVTLTARVFLKSGDHKTMVIKGTGKGFPESLNYYMIELGQRFSEVVPGVKNEPDVHKKKSPFYQDISGEMGPGFFLAVRQAKQDAEQELFKQLDVIVTEAKKTK